MIVGERKENLYKVDRGMLAFFFCYVADLERK